MRAIFAKNPDLFFGKEVTFIVRKDAVGGRTITLGEALLLGATPTYRPKIENTRRVAKLERTRGFGDDSKKLKNQMPVWYPSGRFGNKHTKEDIISFSGLIAIDFDTDQNNLTADAIKAKLSEFSFVLYAGLSIRGEGVYAIIRLPEDAKSEDRFEGYFRAISDTFARNGIYADESCKNINRGRFLSFDDEPFVNPDAEVWQKCEEPKIARRTLFEPAADERSINYRRVEKIVNTAENEGIDFLPSQLDWFVAGRGLAAEFGESGRSFFLRLSKIWSDRNGKQKTDPDKMFDKCLKYPANSVGLGVIFKKAGQCGIYAKREF